MEIFRTILAKKPLEFVVISLVFLFGVGLLKWLIHPPFAAIWYVVGGLIGMYFLDIAEGFFHLSPSPFRSIIFVCAFAIVALFVVTSSGSLFASGLVLAVFLTLLLWQIGEWRLTKSLSTWYAMVAVTVPPATQKRILFATIGVFFLVIFYFIRS